MDEQCPFCRIDKEEQRALKNGKTMRVIFSNPRLMPGHLLVIPKRHITRLFETTQEEREELMELLVEFEEKILKRIASGCDIRQHYKPYVPNSRTSVRHLHVHLQPRNLNDELNLAIDPHHAPLFRALPQDEREKLFSMLKD